MTPNDRTEELFSRYWDGALSPAELAELEDRLRTDAAARERFQTCLLLAMTASELIDVPVAAPAVPVPTDPPVSGASRRRFLRYAAGGIAAGVAGVVAGRLIRPPSQAAAGLQLVSASGDVTFSEHRRPEAGSVVPAGTTITTTGTDSSVTLALDDQSTVILPGDSSVALDGDGRVLTLARGHLAVDIRAATERVKTLRFATDDAAFSLSPASAAQDGAAIVVGRQGQGTDLAVEKGHILINHPLSGRPLAEAKLGDYVTVQANGGRVTKESRRVIPETFRLDLTGPLPRTWETGTRGDDGLLRPQPWFDKYHEAEMMEVRSHNEWTRGFAQVHPDSVVRVRYRVARPGKGQVCFCVRTLYASDTKHRTGVLDSVTAFEDAKPNEWQWFERRADRMLDHKEKPGFPAPWVAFLLIVNTYEQDLGLEIAAVEIIRPPTGGRL